MCMCHVKYVVTINIIIHMQWVKSGLQCAYIVCVLSTVDIILHVLIKDVICFLMNNMPSTCPLFHGSYYTVLYVFVVIVAAKDMTMHVIKR